MDGTQVCLKYPALRRIGAYRQLGSHSSTSLQEDLLQRCAGAGIDSTTWRSDSPYGGATIMLVTPESFVTRPFLDFSNRQLSLEQLDRIVFDECHVFLNARRRARWMMGGMTSGMTRVKMRL